jgi:hypothetical protein
MAVTIRIEVTHHSYQGSTADRALRRGLMAEAGRLAAHHDVTVSRLQIIEPKKKGR